MVIKYKNKEKIERELKDLLKAKKHFSKKRKSDSIELILDTINQKIKFLRNQLRKYKK